MIDDNVTWVCALTRDQWDIVDNRDTHLRVKKRTMSNIGIKFVLISTLEALQAVKQTTINASGDEQDDIFPLWKATDIVI